MLAYKDCAFAWSAATASSTTRRFREVAAAISKLFGAHFGARRRGRHLRPAASVAIPAA
jgi:hypothetical protein